MNDIQSCLAQDFIISINSPTVAQTALPPPCLSSWRTLPAHVWDQCSMPHPPQHFQASTWVDLTWTSLSYRCESLKTRTERQKVRNLSLQTSSIIDEQTCMLWQPKVLSQYIEASFAGI